MTTRRYHVIFNPKSGTAATTGLTREALGALFEQAGLDFVIDDDDDAPLADRIALALAGPADTIVGAGGDGTILAVAEALLGSGKTLAVLPLGTMNGLARDLRLPLDVAGAVAALPALEPRAIDVGVVNGKPFLHNVLIGVIPGIAVGREHMRDKSGVPAMLGFIRFLARRLERSRRIAIAIEADGGPTRIERLQTLMVANNSYEQRLGRFMTRRRIDRGTLTVYIVRSFRLNDVIRLAVKMFAGRWRDDPVVEFESVREVTVGMKRPSIVATMDGEIVHLEAPIHFGVRPASLSVLAPAEISIVAPPVAVADLVVTS